MNDMTQERERVEAILRCFLPDESTRPAALHRAMAYALFAPAKRIRPILVLAAARATGDGDDRAAEPAAAAIECLHTYTLIHDDLPCMDDDDLRRGRPTCHKVFGEALALLAGDALQAKAFELAASSPRAAAEIVSILARAAGSVGVVAGQVEDLEAEGTAPDAEKIRYIELHKTGDLMRASVAMGAAASGATAEERQALETYADRLGEAFQVADDILNATSDAKTLGKAVGTDEARGKTTAVSLLGLDGARARLAELTAAACAALAPLGERAAELSALAAALETRTH
jgi:geranylgeranyl diphosphate synthase type II